MSSSAVGNATLTVAYVVFSEEKIPVARLALLHRYARFFDEIRYLGPWSAALVREADANVTRANASALLLEWHAEPALIPGAARSYRQCSAVKHLQLGNRESLKAFSYACVAFELEALRDRTTRNVLVFHADFWVNVFRLRTAFPLGRLWNLASSGEHLPSSVYDHTGLLRRANQTTGCHTAHTLPDSGVQLGAINHTQAALGEICAWAEYGNLRSCTELLSGTLLWWCFSWIDLWHVPARHMARFVELSRPFLRRKVVHEIATPTIMRLLAEVDGERPVQLSCAGCCCCHVPPHQAAQLLEHNCAHKLDLSRRDGRAALAWALAGQSSSQSAHRGASTSRVSSGLRLS